MRKVIMYCGIFIMILLSGCIRFGKDITDTIYLIPEAYEGDLLVIYNVPGAELLPEEDGFRVVTFSADGTAVTSTADMGKSMTRITRLTRKVSVPNLMKAVYALVQMEALLKTLVKKMSIHSHTRNWQLQLVLAHKASHHTGEKYQKIKNIL